MGGGYMYLMLKFGKEISYDQEEGSRGVQPQRFVLLCNPI